MLMGRNGSRVCSLDRGRINGRYRSSCEAVFCLDRPGRARNDACGTCAHPSKGEAAIGLLSSHVQIGTADTIRGKGRCVDHIAYHTCLLYNWNNVVSSVQISDDITIPVQRLMMLLINHSGTMHWLMSIDCVCFRLGRTSFTHVHFYFHFIFVATRDFDSDDTSRIQRRDLTDAAGIWLKSPDTKRELGNPHGKSERLLSLRFIVSIFLSAIRA